MCGAGFECLSAPLTKSQLRLERRKLHWLHCVAYSRSTLLSMRAPDCPAADALPKLVSRDVDRRLRMTSIGCQTLIGDKETCGSMQRPAVDADAVCSGLEACQEDARLALLDFRELVRQIEAVSLTLLQDTVNEWTVALQEAIARAENLQPADTADIEWVTRGTVVHVEGEFSWLFPFSDSIGVVVAVQRRAREYRIRMLSTGHVGSFPARSVRELVEAQICNLVRTPRLNGQLCFINGLASEAVDEMRLQAELITGKLICIRPDCLADLD
eukprot:TRINITY_DN72627_c0_g1_i1.p1 TRINITY_DN72627_c0_g1~~TRINITY_DN72627_c0_g1_i1.p1  ORF type:complete len:271 (-),score=19.08 TRINITY_DN72627_c0_g1_i1:157-969(-)